MNTWILILFMETASATGGVHMISIDFYGRASCEQARIAAVDTTRNISGVCVKKG